MSSIKDHSLCHCSRQVRPAAMAGGRFPWSNPSQPSAQGPFPETAVDSPGMAELCLVQDRTGKREDPWNHREFSPWNGTTECQGWGCTRLPGLHPAPLPLATGEMTGAVPLGSYGRGQGFRLGISAP